MSAFVDAALRFPLKASEKRSACLLVAKVSVTSKDIWKGPGCTSIDYHCLPLHSMMIFSMLQPKLLSTLHRSGFACLFASMQKIGVGCVEGKIWDATNQMCPNLPFGGGGVHSQLVFSLKWHFTQLHLQVVHPNETNVVSTYMELLLRCGYQKGPFLWGASRWCAAVIEFARHFPCSQCVENGTTFALMFF